MDEIDYTDTGLDDFLERGMGITPRPKNKAILGSVQGEGILTGGFNADKAALDPIKSLDKVEASMNASAPKGLLDKAGGAAGVMSMATGAMDLTNMAMGKQYDTSAEGGGVMSATSAIASGATKGAQAGMALGPWGAAGGAVIGGLVGGLSRASANREYGENRKKYNLANDELSKAESAETYQMEQGKESLGLLKGLRQKQLGILNT